MTVEKKIMPRFYFLIIGISVFIVIVVFKLLFIQLVKGEEYKESVSSMTLKNFNIKPERGTIFSDDGNILATSVIRYDIRWDSKSPSEKSFTKYKDELAISLAEMFEKPKSYYIKKLTTARSKNNRYLLIAKNLTYSEKEKIKQFPLFQLGSIKGGLIVEQKSRRVKPLGKMAERTIGYEKQDAEGYYLRVGIEGAFSQYLRGENGRRLKQKIANGQWKPISDNNQKDPVQGYDVHTTININIQDITHHSLLNQLEKYQAEHGTAIVMETSTGKIKAISNLGKTKKGSYYEKLNYAISYRHEPGSTFKLLSMIIALEDKVAKGSDWIDTKNGTLDFYGHTIKDTKKGGHGKIQLSKAFEVSSNTGLVKVITKHYTNNPKKFVDRLFNMGVHKKLGIPIIGEPPPKIPYPAESDWDGLDLPWMAFGYGVAFTPLQILTYYNAIANNGQMIKPRFVDYIESYNKKHTVLFHKEVMNPSICSNETLVSIKNMMRNVIEKPWGTAYEIKDERFTMAGKTGTCQVDYATEDATEYISSFVGYFPADNPKYSCIITVHKPNKKLGYYGGEIAAPVFKKIAEKIHISTTKEVLVKDQLINKKNTLPSIKESSLKMPNLIGLAGMDAIAILENKKVEVEVKGKGKVKKQSVKAGRKINKKQKITLILS